MFFIRNVWSEILEYVQASLHSTINFVVVLMRNKTYSFTDTVADRILKIKSSEDDFQTLLRKLLEEAGENLKSVEKEAETCTNNLNLW